MIPHQSQADPPVEIAPANILASRIWRLHASPGRGRLVKEAVFAVEEEEGESRSGGCGAVVVSEAEGVGVAGCGDWVAVGGCHVLVRCVLAVVQVNRVFKR